MKHIFILSLFCTLPVFLSAQSFTIRGVVHDERAQALPSASITLIDQAGLKIRSSFSDQEGRFSLNHDQKGIYRVIISFTGFKTDTTEAFQLGDRDLGIIRLVPLSVSLGEVVVADKQPLVELDAGTIIFNVSKSIEAQGVNALDLLKRAPGVYVNTDNSVSLNGKAGILILLDGKQTYLSGAELTDLLQSMSSSNVRSIEIINSPSARYDAAGAAGIINIRTNRSQIKGFNGSGTTGLSYGVFLRQNQDLSFNYRKNKINVFGGYSHFLGYVSYLYGSDRLQNGAEYHSFTDDVDKKQRMNGRLGLDYQLNKKNTLGILLSGNFVFGGGLTDTRTEIFDSSSAQADQVLRAVNDYYSQHTERYNLNLNYKYEDSLGRILNIDADYGSFAKGNGNLQSNRYADRMDVQRDYSLYRSLTAIGIDLKAVKLDYTANLGKGKLETGIKLSDIRAGNESKFMFALKQDSIDDRRSNRFNYNEQIGSTYLNYKQTIRKWSFQAGLRLENSATEGLLRFRHMGRDSIESIRRNYLNLFPSMSLSVKPSANHSFSLSYSRRIDRPAYQDLNPFVYLLDELSYWQGNPFLKPQLSHRASLLYAFKSSTIIGINFAYTNDFSTRINDTLDQNKIILVYRNLGIQKNIALTLTQRVEPAPWWNMTFNGTIYRLQNDIAFDQFRNFNLIQLAGTANLQQSFKLNKTLTGELIGSFISRRLSGANDVSNAYHQVNLGLQQEVLKGRGSLRLVLNDLYKGNKLNSQQSYEGFRLRNYGYYESRQLRLNFSYKFADASVKGPRTRGSALGEETGRIK